MLNKKLKKAVSAVTMFATVVCLSGVSMLAPLSASAATTIVDGDIVKSNATNSDGTPALSSLDVYIVKTVGTKKFKRLVLNPQIFQSYGHLKWENLKTVSQAEIDGYTTSSLVRVDGNDKVYALTPVAGGDTGAKSWINVSAAQFLSLSQSDPDSIYTINAVDGAAYSVKADITTTTQLSAFYADGTLPADATGDLTVSLAAATPEAMSIPVDSSAEFAAIKLAAGSSAASISSITVTASGFGTATNLDDVALYVDGVKVGSSKDINSEKEATFNFSTPIKVSANSSKTLTIRAIADLAGTYKLGIAEAADIITGGTVGGSFPIYGNGMVADDNVDAGDIDMTNVETSDSSNSFGEDNVLLAAFDLTANDEGAIVDTLRFKNGGTNQADIISNLKLFIDGEDVADGSYDSSTGYVTFDVNGEYKIEEGDTASFEVYGDLGVASANDTIDLYVKNVDDLAFIGEDYGFGVQVNSITSIDAASEGVVVTLTTGDVTINMDKAATPAQDIKIDTDNIVVATFEITSNGENATLEDIVDSADDEFEIQGTGLAAGDIENVEMRDVDTGAIYDITATRNSDTEWVLSMTDEISLAKGVTKTFEIRLDTTSTTDENDTLKVVIDKEALTITGDESDSSITDITPATVSSAISTVAIASLDWTTSALIAKTVVPSATDVVLYQATLEAGDVDDVKLSSVTLTTNGAGVLDDFTDDNISSIELYLGGKKINSTSPSIVESVVGTPGHITFSSLNTDAVVAAGATATLEVVADFASSLTHVASFSLEIDNATTSIIAKSKSDNEAIAEDVANVGTGSRTITVTEQGTLKVELLTSSTKADDDTLLLAGASSAADKYLGELKFTTANEPIKVTELRLENSGTATSATIAEVQLVDSTGAVKASKIPAANGSATFIGLDLVLPADQATSYFIAIKAKGMNVDGDASSTAVQGATAIYNISDTLGVVAEGVDSGLDTTLAVSADATVIAGEWAYETTKTKTTTVSGSVLTSVVSALSDGTLQGGSDKIVGKYTLTFENGSNRTTTNEELKAILDDLTVTVSQSGALTLADYKIYREDAPATVVNATAGSVWTNALGSLADSGKVDGAVTLVITADVTTTAADGEYLQTSIATPSTALTYTVDGTAVANSYLGVTTVNGGTLSE